MSANPQYRRILIGLFALLAISGAFVCAGAWWMLRDRPGELAESGKTAAPAPQENEHPGSLGADEPLIGDLSELGIPSKKDDAAALADVLMSPADVDAREESYRLTDGDYILEAIRAGYLLWPAQDLLK